MTEEVPAVEVSDVFHCLLEFSPDDLGEITRLWVATPAVPI
jgi:hypothetical protein